MMEESNISFHMMHMQCEEDTKSTISNKCVFLQEDTKSTINSQIHRKKLKELYVGSWQISKIGIR